MQPSNSQATDTQWRIVKQWKRKPELAEPADRTYAKFGDANEAARRLERKLNNDAPLAGGSWECYPVYVGPPAPPPVLQ